MDHRRSALAQGGLAVVDALAERAHFAGDTLETVGKLRHLSLSGLRRMYDPAHQRFVFCLRRSTRGIEPEGLSARYTAISLIGLACEAESNATAVLAGDSPLDVCGRLIREVDAMNNMGDVALTLWAATALGHADAQAVQDRLLQMRPETLCYPTVEVAWSLAALSLLRKSRLRAVCRTLAERLIKAVRPGTFVFPHVLGETATAWRSHVSCFADLVYPIHALSTYAVAYGDSSAASAAGQCARHMCHRQGSAGQWWWHHDARTGAVVERYPVYAVHQDSMAPMALFAAMNASGEDFTAPIAKGLSWLVSAPELRGGSLIDEIEGLIWRKVARRDTRKLARGLQALASRAHRPWRIPGIDALFPARVVDYEDRPYHLGWVLYAWHRVGTSRSPGERSLSS